MAKYFFLVNDKMPKYRAVAWKDNFLNQNFDVDYGVLIFNF